MAAWTAKVDNNRNNPNKGGEPIPVIRVCNNIPTIAMNLIWNTMSVDITQS